MIDAELTTVVVPPGQSFSIDEYGLGILETIGRGGARALQNDVSCNSARLNPTRSDRDANLGGTTMAIPTLEQKLKWLKPTPATKHELECVSRIELGDYEIGFQRTNDILDEGMEVFVRSCRSAMGIAGDSLVGIMTADGDMVNGSCGTYLHAVIPPLIIKYILHSYRDNPGIRDGDLWFANDAVYGGIHNPDQMVAMPVFYGGELIAWTVALVHTTETGAVEPGGMPVSASARFQEGMNFPPMKIGENFRLNDDVVELFAAFGVRAPQMVAVDLKARCTTADRVRTRLIELCDKEGPDYLKGLFRKMLMMAEQGARERLKFWPDGKYRCVTFSDAVGLNQGLGALLLHDADKAGRRLSGRFQRHRAGDAVFLQRAPTGGDRSFRQLRLRISLSRSAD